MDSTFSVFSFNGFNIFCFLIQWIQQFLFSNSILFNIFCVLIQLYSTFSVFSFNFFHRWRLRRTRGGRRMLPTKTSTTCSNSWLSAILRWEKPPFSSDTPTTPSPPPSSRPLASTSKSRQFSGTTSGLNSKFGLVNYLSLESSNKSIWIEVFY